MKKILNKFYLNKFTFIISSIIAITGFMAWGINYLSFSQYTKAIYAFIYATLVIMLFIAYKKGETNLQKMLLGALLTYQLYNSLNTLVYDIQAQLTKAMIIWTINSILIIIIFISHMIQQMDHKGSSISTVVSQCCGILIVGAQINQIMHILENYITYATVIWTISSTATYIFIIAMETRINEYKKVRTAKKAEGCWTEEARKEAKKIFSI